MARQQAAEQLPAFAVIEHDDHRGALWIATILSFIFVGITFATRMYVRKHMLGRDDFANMAAVALAVTQYASLFTGMPSGLGTSKLSVTQGNKRKNGSLLLTSQAAFICGLYMAKFAVLLATERLLATSMKATRRICFFIRGALAAAALVSILLLTVRCPIDGLLVTKNQSQCSGLGARWLVISLLDGGTELVILCVFYGLVWTLQMKTSRKWMLTILLGLRMLCPVFTGICTSAIRSYSRSSNPEVQVMSPLVWQQVALGYSLIAALLIALIPFLRSFHTGMSLNVQHTTTGEWGSSVRSRDDGYRLRNMSKNSAKQDSGSRNVALSQAEMTRSQSPAGDAPAWLETRSNSRSEDGSIEGQKQQPQPPDPLVIQKTVDWSVQYEQNESTDLGHPGLPRYLN